MNTKILPVVLAIITTNIAAAQIKKGEIMLGGTITVSTSHAKIDNSPNEAKTFGFDIEPIIGFGFNKSWIGGVGIGYAYNESVQTVQNNEQKEYAKAFALKIFIRKFKAFNDYFGLFGQAETGYGIGTDHNPPGSFPARSKFSFFSLSAVPGIYFRPNKRFSVEGTFGSIGYNYAVYHIDGFDKSKYSTFSFSLVNDLSLGFYVVL